MTTAFWVACSVFAVITAYREWHYRQLWQDAYALGDELTTANAINAAKDVQIQTLTTLVMACGVPVEQPPKEN